MSDGFHFFKNLGKKKGSAPSKKAKPPQLNFRNPFEPKFKGDGKSLAGSKTPGKVLKMELIENGPLGAKVEKTSLGGAIIAAVYENTQASMIGLKRGDVICIRNSAGEEEMMFEQFLEMVKASPRPLPLEIRRVNPIKKNAEYNPDHLKSAEAFSQKQAVIAAAEARSKKHERMTRPLRKGGPSKLDKPKPEIDDRSNDAPMSERAKKAIAQFIRARLLDGVNFSC